MKDRHTYGKKMTRNGRTKDIYKGTFVCIQTLEKHRVTNSVIRMAFFAHGGISIKLFVVYLHIINECLSYKFHPYSISTGHTKVESVAYKVLSLYFN